MKRIGKITIIVVALAAIVGLSGCSTKKNTAMSRFFHSFTTSYNVKFNGKVSYRDGIEAIQTANIDDYTDFLPMYPISNLNSQKAATTQMDKTIDKSRKAIKTHSITKKPTKNLRRWSNPKYQSFYNQQEFNSALKESWLLLAKSEFHKGDFFGSVGTFSYISKHYPEDKDIVGQCKIWMARAYIEIGWTYEAEEILNKIDQNDLKRRNRPLFDNVEAQLLLKQKQYDRAIPYLETTLNNAENKYQRARIAFILGQIAKKQGDTQKANSYFSKVIKMSPPYEMSFYARVNRIDVNDNDFKKNHNTINSMIKNPNNKEYRDQLYYTDALIYLAQKDTVKALGQLTLAADSSSRNGIDKAKALVLAGDIYYSQKNYVKAYPCFADAATIIPAENDMYARVNNLSSLLGELAAENQIVITNDSLLQIAALSSDEQMTYINKIIEEKKKADDMAQKKADKDARNEQNSTYNPFGDDSQQNPQMNMGGTNANWYFYNANLIQSGKSDFRRKWGNRRLEDNWRRTSKSNTMFASDNQDASQTDDNSDNIADTDSVTTGDKAQNSTDPYDPQFYLQQLPLTRAAKAQANEQIATSLFNMGTILKDKLEDFPSAMNVFDEYEHRFANHPNVPDAYFQQFIIMERTGNQAQSGLFRSKILTEYPESKYAQILQNPNFVEQQQRMFAEQDSIYSATYAAYMHNDFSAVFSNNNYVKQNFPNSKLMPKFDFLSAMTVGRTLPRDTFAITLSNIIANYPQADVTPMAKDILALVGQGRENIQGGSSGNLINLREETINAENQANNKTELKDFSLEKMSKHRLMLNAVANKKAMNELLYQVAVYNFSRFMIKDFELVMTNIDSIHNILSITNLESYDEACWYEKSLAVDTVIAPLFVKLNITPIVISEDNYALLQAGGDLNKYMTFEKEIENYVAPDTTKNNTELAENKLISINNTKNKNQKESVDIKVLELPKEETTKQEQVQTNEKQKTDEIQVKQEQKDEIKQNTEQTSTEETSKTDEIKPEQQPSKEEELTDTTKTQTILPPVEQQKPELPKYKNLFTIDPDAEHVVALYVMNGKIDTGKISAAFDTYNTDNYSIMNLNVTFEKFGTKDIVVIGTFPNADTAKSYLLRMVNQSSLFDGLKGTTYRNLVGTLENLKIATANAANLTVYSEFMKEFYLK